MQKLVSPLCLLLALLMMIAGFALWAVDAPEASVELHRARVTGDEAYTDVLEEQLANKQGSRHALLWCLFGGSGLMVLAAFLSMRPTNSA